MRVIRVRNVVPSLKSNPVEISIIRISKTSWAGSHNLDCCRRRFSRRFSTVICSNVDTGASPRDGVVASDAVTRRSLSSRSFSTSTQAKRESSNTTRAQSGPARSPTSPRPPPSQKPSAQSRTSRLPHGSRRVSQTPEGDETIEDDLLVETHEELVKRLQDEAREVNVGVDLWNDRLNQLTKLYDSTIRQHDELKQEPEKSLQAAQHAGREDYQDWSNEQAWEVYREKHIRPLFDEADRLQSLSTSLISEPLWDVHRRQSIEPHEVKLHRSFNSIGSLRSELESIAKRVRDFNDEVKRYEAFSRGLPARAEAVIGYTETLKVKFGPHYEMNKVGAACSQSGLKLFQKLEEVTKSWQGIELGIDANNALLGLRGKISLSKHVKRIEATLHNFRRLEMLIRSAYVLPEATNFGLWCEKFLISIANYREDLFNLHSFLVQIVPELASEKIPWNMFKVDKAMFRNGNILSDDFIALLNGGFTLLNPYTSHPIGKRQFYDLAPLYSYISRVGLPFDELQVLRHVLGKANKNNYASASGLSVLDSTRKKIGSFDSVFSLWQRECYLEFQKIIAYSTARLLKTYHDPRREEKFMSACPPSPLRCKELLAPVATDRLFSMDQDKSHALLSSRKYLGDGSLYPVANSINVTFVTEAMTAVEFIEKFATSHVVGMDMIYRERSPKDNFEVPYLLILADIHEIAVINLSDLRFCRAEYLVSSLSNLLENPQVIKVGWRMSQQRNALQKYGISAISCIDVPLELPGFHGFVTNSDYRGVSSATRDFEIAARPFIALTTFLSNFGPQELQLIPTTVHQYLWNAKHYLRFVIEASLHDYQLGPIFVQPGVDSTKTLDSDSWGTRDKALRVASMARASDTWEILQSSNPLFRQLSKSNEDVAEVKRDLAAYYLATTFAEDMTTIRRALSVNKPAVRILHIAEIAQLRLNAAHKENLEKMAAGRAAVSKPFSQSKTLKQMPDMSDLPETSAIADSNFEDWESIESTDAESMTSWQPFS